MYEKELIIFGVQMALKEYDLFVLTKVIHQWLPKNSIKETGLTTKNSTLPTGKLNLLSKIVSSNEPAAITDISGICS